MSSPRRVVVVDDDPKLRRLMEKAFKAPDFETHAFASGRGALQRVAEIRPHCIVSDLLMPDIDGERLLEAVRATPGLETVPFVFVSAVRSEARIRSVLQAGASAFLPKPFPLRDLVARVRQLLGDAPPEPGADAPSGVAVLVSPDDMPTVELAALDAAAAAVAAPDATPSGTAPVSRDVRLVDVQTPPSGTGSGRYTRVGVRGRSLAVLTEATLRPSFVITTVVTEKGQALRKVESLLPHPLARDEDREVVRRQVDLQHDSVLQRIEDLVLDGVRRTVLWTEQNRSVDPGLLAWAVSALAQQVETRLGTDETRRLLQATLERSTTLERSAGLEPLLSVFQVTPSGRVVVDAARRDPLPRRAVAGAAGWCVTVAMEGLRLDAEAALHSIRGATARRGSDLERLGFYGRPRRRG